MTILTQEYLKERLYYNPDSGDFIWKDRKGTSSGDRSFNTQFSGKSAGHINKCSNENLCYLEIKLEHKIYKAHRLAFLYMTGKFPPKQVDHKDRDGINNKWNNLRPATASQNCANCGIPKNNTSGFKGVSFVKKAGKYHAYITINRKRTNIGFFHTPEEAHIAYKLTAKKYFGEFAGG